MEIDKIYTTLEEAKAEIQRRWNDPELKRKVDEYLKGNIPEPLRDEPKAISTAHIATPNWAFYRFWEGAKSIGLKPLAFEYTDDLFVTTNYDKASLAKMVFYHGKDDHANMITSHRHIIDLTGKNEKKKINTIETTWGENFVDFHHRALHAFYSGVEIYDGSPWYHAMGNNAKEYYKYVLALYIRNGVLFENFMLSKKEGVFTKEIFLPAFEFVTKTFGVRPLIVPIWPHHESDNKYWWCYPQFVKILLR
jgi:hypothetical protein